MCVSLVFQIYVSSIKKKCPVQAFTKPVNIFTKLCEICNSSPNRITESSLQLTNQNNPYALHNRLLLSTDDVETMDRNGNTALLVAARNGYTECLAQLLDVGHANYKQVNVFGGFDG